MKIKRLRRQEKMWVGYRCDNESWFIRQQGSQYQAVYRNAAGQEQILLVSPSLWKTHDELSRQAIQEFQARDAQQDLDEADPNNDAFWDALKREVAEKEKTLRQDQINQRLSELRELDRWETKIKAGWSSGKPGGSKIYRQRALRLKAIPIRSWEAEMQGQDEEESRHLLPPSVRILN
jgi:molybdopterin converting factor small subunit